MADDKQTDATDQTVEAEATGTETGAEVEDTTGPLEPKEFLKAIEEAGQKEDLDKYLESVIAKEVESRVDKRVTEAIQTHDKKLKAKQRKEKAEKEKLEAEQNMTEQEKKISGLEDSLTKMTDMFEKFMGTVKGEKLTSAKEEALKGAGLPMEWMKLLEVEEESDIPDRIKEIQAGIEKFTEGKVEKWVDGQKAPFKSSGDTTTDKIRLVQDYIKKKQQISTTGLAAEQLGLIKE